MHLRPSPPRGVSIYIDERVIGLALEQLRLPSSQISGRKISYHQPLVVRDRDTGEDEDPQAAARIFTHAV
jgi:hypothetical protein